MHEYSIVKKEVERLSHKINGKKVNKVVFSLGRLSHGTPDSITAAFQSAIVDTPLAKAKLQVLNIEPRVKCLSCGKISQVVGDLNLNCIKCGSFSSELVQGEECYISSVEVED